MSAEGTPPRPTDLAKSRHWPLSPGEPCPRVELHADSPSSYLAWHEWAREKGKTHVQELCPGCGLWRVWKPKRRSASRALGNPTSVSDAPEIDDSPVPGVVGGKP